MKPIKQMKIELGLKKIRDENDEVATRRAKRDAKRALDIEAELQLGPGLPSTRGPFYTNRAMRRAGFNPLANATRSPEFVPVEMPAVKSYGVGDMLRAVRGLRRKTG